MALHPAHRRAELAAEGDVLLVLLRSHYADCWIFPAGLGERGKGGGEPGRKWAE